MVEISAAELRSRRAPMVGAYPPCPTHGVSIRAGIPTRECLQPGREPRAVKPLPASRLPFTSSGA
ncbi:Hypothetical protein CAP_6394 [Chondromyces apiculatus DSM 436]|uniref:Uncharacterized protein n=1 Tax=Chondromyces apiculatus DSM 436 TaxID=1192034 RepID=A0A017T349_9BACT|nr:Hypothetical protein CAP_6394 [Chondromyces apiculatus DSM 436]